MANVYEQLQAMQSLRELTNPAQFVTIPDDWQVVITDIRGSTLAIEAGRYKAVNMIAAASIVAVLNGVGETEIPFVFGGDGASLVIPPELLERIRPALTATQNLAKQEFQLDLRVGIVPVAVISQSAFQLQVAKLQVSPHYTQAIFSGGGLRYAEILIKDPQTAPRYQLQPQGIPEADYSGLECRWQDIPSPHGETVSLLISAVTPDEDLNSQIYQAALEQIEQIYGSGIQRRPVGLPSLRLSFRDRQLQLETQVKQAGKGWLRQWLYRIRLKAENVLGWVFIQLKVGTWSRYPELVVAASDFEKFDDTLRMVISGTPAQRAALITYLDSQFQQKQLVYGIHVSDRALMTCLVFEREGRQVHFIDGADGGYALAAKALKSRHAMSPPGSKPAPSSRNTNL